MSWGQMAWNQSSYFREENTKIYPTITLLKTKNFFFFISFFFFFFNLALYNSGGVLEVLVVHMLSYTCTVCVLIHVSFQCSNFSSNFFLDFIEILCIIVYYWYNV